MDTTCSPEAVAGTLLADMNSAKSVPATASGLQVVSIYINGTLVSSYSVQF